MGSATLRPLDESLAYVYCKICADNGTPNVPLRRSMHLIVCSLNPSHQFTFEQLKRMGAEMMPMSTVITETPNPTSIAWKIFVAPKTKEAIEARFPGRIIVTVATLLDALADDQIIFIQGSEAAELKKKGIKNGMDIVSFVKSVDQLEKDRDEAVKQVDRFRDMLRTVGAEE